MGGPNAALAGAIALAAVNTLGDYIWANYVPRHRMLFGLTHGTLLLLALGAYLGLVRRRPALGALGGAVVGLSAAALFYALVKFIGWSAMFVAWVALWIGFAVLDIGLLQRQPFSREAWVRGAVAALGSGVAFYAVSGIWTQPHPDGPSYGYNFLCWTVAFLPGLTALLIRRPRVEVTS
jgi:hypothetical protein